VCRVKVRMAEMVALSGLLIVTCRGRGGESSSPRVVTCGRGAVCPPLPRTLPGGFARFGDLCLGRSPGRLLLERLLEGRGVQHKVVKSEGRGDVAR
jgi:hypothetical protein